MRQPDPTFPHEFVGGKKSLLTATAFLPILCLTIPPTPPIRTAHGGLLFFGESPMNCATQAIAFTDFFDIMRYVGKRFDEADGKEWPCYGVFYLDDLRPKHERDQDE